VSQEARVGTILGLQESSTPQASELAFQALPKAQDPWEILALLGVAVRGRNGEFEQNEKFMKSQIDRVGLKRIMDNAGLKRALVDAIELAHSHNRVGSEFYETYKKLLSHEL